MNEYYYSRLAGYLKKAKENLENLEKVKDGGKIYRRLRKKIPDLICSIYQHARIEFKSEWVNKNWTHTTYGSGGCSAYKLRGYIIIDGFKIYSTYTAHLGYTEYPDYRATYFVNNSNIGKSVKNMGERIREPMKEAIQKYEDRYNNEDED